jgi:CheY-like chemotaxis protein
MARVSGDAACAALRAAGCQIPVIAVSGNLEAPDYVRRYGFSAMLGKPFTQEQLREALQVYVPPRHA